MMSDHVVQSAQMTNRKERTMYHEMTREGGTTIEKTSMVQERETDMTDDT
jgi:hypothetical protein